MSFSGFGNVQDRVGKSASIVYSILRRAQRQHHLAGRSLKGVTGRAACKQAVTTGKRLKILSSVRNSCFFFGVLATFSSLRTFVFVCFCDRAPASYVSNALIEDRARSKFLRSEFGSQVDETR